MKNFFIKKNKQGGFTLVETLVAVSIFSMTLVAVMTSLGQGVSDTNYAKNKITAEYLAQEGIEYVRNLRDTYVLFPETTTDVAWGEFSNALIPNPPLLCGDPHGCYFDLNPLEYDDLTGPMFDVDIALCPMFGCSTTPLLYDAATGKYGYTPGGVNSGFSRAIRVEEIVDDEQTKVTSTVYWKKGSTTHSVSFSEILFNWTE